MPKIAKTIKPAFDVLCTKAALTLDDKQRHTLVLAIAHCLAPDLKKLADKLLKDAEQEQS